MTFKRLFRPQTKIEGNDLQDGEASAQPNLKSPQPSQLPEQEAVEEQPAETFYERDNRAARILRLSQADDFWRRQQNRRSKVPFLRYVFESEIEAVDALLSLSCVQRAVDTGNLLCTEPITLGCYRTLENRYEAFLAGKELRYAIWSEAVQKFSDHRGHHRDQLKPETDDSYKDRPGIHEVVFEKEYYQMGPEGTHFYQVFKAPSVPAARAFLQQHENMIMVPDKSILVEAPEGILCRDMDGIHEKCRNEDPCKHEDHAV